MKINFNLSFFSMENVILKTLLKSDENTINEMSRTSREVRNVCKEFKNPLAKHIIEQRVKNSTNTINLKKVLKEYKNNYSKMLVEWTKWGRSKLIKIVDSDFEDDDRLDIKKSNKVLDKPENQSFKKSLIGDIVSINYGGDKNEFKFIFDGKSLESLDSYQDEDGTVPKSYLVIDEFHIRYWEDTIYGTSVPVILPEPKSIMRSELGECVFYTFEKNEKTFYLFLYSDEHEPIIPNISFNKVNFLESYSPLIAEWVEEYPEFADHFAKINTDNFFIKEHDEDEEDEDEEDEAKNRQDQKRHIANILESNIEWEEERREKEEESEDEEDEDEEDEDEDEDE